MFRIHTNMKILDSLSIHISLNEFLAKFSLKFSLLLI